MEQTLNNIYNELGISKTHLLETKLSRCRESLLEDLRVVNIDEMGSPVLLNFQAASCWAEMVAAAHEENIHLKAYYGFRSYLHQKQLITRHLKSGRVIDDILGSIAIPGYSEHHTGFAVDVVSDECMELLEEFEKTKAFAWLQKNASFFKFRLSYPRNNKQGIIFEPWHWCYHD